jgi:CubicO group peptidase (beta-lactamase class C family)
VSEDAASALPRTRRFLEAELRDGRRVRGAQVCARVKGRAPAELALGDAGLGRAVATDTVFKVYCTTKPVTAVAVAGLVDQGRIDLDEPLSRRLPAYPALGRAGITARHLLTHTAGLHATTATHMEVIPTALRPRYLEEVEVMPGWQVGLDAGYSEVVGWLLLGQLIEHVTGRLLADHLRTCVLGPLGMGSTWFGMDDEVYDQVSERLGVNYDLRTPRAYPVLMEVGRRVCAEVNCAYGGYTTAADLARFYGRLSARLDGADDPSLPSRSTLVEFCSPARAPVYDQVLARECQYGLGFMVDLAGHEFGHSCSRRSFGHSGWLGSSYAFADPAHGLAVGVLLNGIIEAGPSFARRPALTDALYADLGLGR